MKQFITERGNPYSHNLTAFFPRDDFYASLTWLEVPELQLPSTCCIDAASVFVNKNTLWLVGGSRIEYDEELRSFYQVRQLIFLLKL